jgi:putative flippase GtrA
VLIYSFNSRWTFREMRLRNGRVVVTDQLDKNFIADLLVLLVILVVVVGGFALLHTSAILLGGGLALVVAVAAEFAWSR